MALDESILPSPKKLLTGGPAADAHVHAHLNGVVPVSSVKTESAATDAQKAPADSARQPALWERLSWYAGAVVVTSLLLIGGLRLDAFDLHTPLGYDFDALLIMPLVKTTVEQGHHWWNDRLGSPGRQELYTFPVIDHLHFALIWLIGQFVPDWMAVYNLYFLLTWPLTTLTAMFAFRCLGFTLPMAASGAILYAFAPYHYLRGELHYFLAAYWMIPLSWLPALELCKGNFPFFRRDPDGRYRLSLLRWATWWQVLLAAATASAGAYYAFFACAVYAAGGMYGWVFHRTWKAFASAAMLAIVVVGFGVVNHLPAFLHVLTHGETLVIGRSADESEIYGLKIAQLLLPIDGHNLGILDRLKARYNWYNQYMPNESQYATLGLISSLGLLILFAVLLLPMPKRWPYGPLAALAGFIVLFATIGGFSSLFSLLVFEQIRCPNRFSIYLAFICLFAALWPLDRFLTSRTGWARRLLFPAAAGLVALGIFDQTPSAWFGPAVVEERRGGVERFQADQRFFSAIEESMPPGSKVFLVPHMRFPEVPALNRLETYEHMRGYLHTRTLFWSYGAMKKIEEIDTSWQNQVTQLPTDEFFDEIVAAGFDGLIVDKRGFASANTWVGRLTGPNDGEVYIAAVKQEAEKNGRVHVPMIYHEDKQQVFFDLRLYRDWLNRHNEAKQ